MNNNFFTIYEVADRLGLHHKTIRGFISDGKLKAIKVGKQWRITQEDLDIFMGRNTVLERDQNFDQPQIDLENNEIKYTTNNHENTNSIKNGISVSAVVDIQSVDKYKFERMSNTLLAVMNSKDMQSEHATIHIKYEEAARMCKVFLWGSVGYINEMLSIITLLDQEVN
jgi:DNA binding domain, excisionase family